MPPPPPERKEKTTYYVLANFQCNTEVLPEIDEGKEESYF
jgi:ribosomal protein S6